MGGEQIRAAFRALTGRVIVVLQGDFAKQHRLKFWVSTRRSRTEKSYSSNLSAPTDRTIHSRILSTRLAASARRTSRSRAWPMSRIVLTESGSSVSASLGNVHPASARS